MRHMAASCRASARPGGWIAGSRGPAGDRGERDRRRCTCAWVPARQPPTRASAGLASVFVRSAQRGRAAVLRALGLPALAPVASAIIQADGCPRSAATRETACSASFPRTGSCCSSRRSSWRARALTPADPGRSGRSHPCTAVLLARTRCSSRTTRPQTMSSGISAGLVAGRRGRVLRALAAARTLFAGVLAATSASRRRRLLAALGPGRPAARRRYPRQAARDVRRSGTRKPSSWPPGTR